MQVAFFADLLYYRIAAGTTRYAGELVRHLCAIPRIDLRLFSLYPQDVIDRVAQDREYPPATSLRETIPRPLRYLLWHTLGWAGPAAALLDAADVVHTPVLLVPPRRSRALVVSVLDLSFLLYPQFHGRWSRATARMGLGRAVRDADALIAISAHTADDLVRLTGVDWGRVHVIPLAADLRFEPVRDPSVPARYGIDSRYVLYLGTLEPRKNLKVLLHAFARLDATDAKLVLAGAKGWMFQEIFETVERLGLTSRVVFPGFVADADLPALLNGAEVFVYPSEYEGFGLPVLEAMSCGTPVVTTHVSSLPEVAGEAALLVPPRDAGALHDALRRVLSEPTLREEMRGRGLERAAGFSWARTARETADVYRRVVR